MKTKQDLDDVLMSISLMKQSMEDWRSVLVENSSTPYQKGLLAGYEMSIKQFENWIGEYCDVTIMFGFHDPEKITRTD
jgi:hypothetical protein